MTRIGSDAFNGCPKFSEITIDSSLVTIENNCFKDSISHKKVSIKSSVSSISREAFSGCTVTSIINLQNNIDMNQLAINETILCYDKLNEEIDDGMIKMLIIFIVMVVIEVVLIVSSMIFVFCNREKDLVEDQLNRFHLQLLVFEIKHLH